MNMNRNAIKSGFKNYANFSGRGARSEYWYWILFVSVGSTFFHNALDWGVLGISDPRALHPFEMIFGLITFLPTLAITVRRLHDTDRSGWWLLIDLTIIGIIYPMFYWMCTKGTTGANRFGADPLA